MQGSPRIDELRQKFHENPRRYFAPLANEYRKAGDPEQAIAICRAHLAQQPGHMSGHVVYGQALYDAKRPEEARVIFEKALSLDPDNAIVLRQLGDIAREKGDAPEAKHWYSKAIDLDPHDTEVAAYIAELTEPVSGDETISDEQLSSEPLTVEPVLDEPPSIEEPASEEPASPAIDEVAESTEAEVEEAVAAATPADPQGDGADPESPDTVEAASVAEPEPDMVSDREVALQEIQEPEVEARAEEPAAEAPVAHEDAEDIEAAGETAWRKTPQPQSSPFITRTMADLYARQGYTAAALDVYRQLALRDPDDSELRQRIAELSGEGSEDVRTGAIDQPAMESVETAADSSELATETVEPVVESVEPSAELTPFEPMTEPFAELSDRPAFPPSSEDLNLETVEADDLTGGLHFTEMEISDTVPGEVVELDESPFGELSWGDEVVDSQSTAAPELPPAPREEVVQEAAPVAPPAPEPEQPEPQALPVAEVEAEPQPEPEPQRATGPELVSEQPEPEPEPEPSLPPVEETPAEMDELAAASEAAIPAEARFVDMPVALAEVQTSIDEAGVAATSPHADDFPPAASADQVAAAAEPFAAEDEAAAAMSAPEVDKTEALAAEPEESAVVAYSPEPPRDEDLPHFTPRTQTIREFFAALGAHRPSSRESSITARAAIPKTPPRNETVEDLPLATDAFSSLFPDAPVSEEDTRAAFALSGALSGTAHNPTPPTVRTSPPKPVPPVTDAPDQTKESEEDIRRFREWLDGLADS